MKRVAFALLMFAALVTPVWADTSAGTWRVIKRARGITVSVRDEPNRELPTLRGEGTIRGDVLHVLAVVLDAKAATEWAKGADEVEFVRDIDPRTAIYYTRTHTPWPVSDRDMLMRRTISVDRVGDEFHVRLVCTPKERPQVRGVVRITDCDTYFHLRKVDAVHTFVDYQVNVDPGGSLPTWLIRWASTSIPYDTLVNLEKQVSKTKRRYDGEIKVWSTAN